MTDEPDTAELENRIDSLESTIEKMMPSRRDALKMGGAALAGGSLMAGTASAGTNQVGTIGSASQLVDIESEDINNTDTVTTENLVVNGTATGPFGGGAPLLEPGDTITVETLNRNDTKESFVTLYSGAAKDVLGGVVNCIDNSDFLYEFSDNSTIRKNGTGTSYTAANINRAEANTGDIEREVDFLPPAKDIIRIEVGSENFGDQLAAEVILKD